MRLLAVFKHTKVMNMIKKIALVALSLILLSGCSGAGKKPTLVNQKEDDKAYSMLMQANLLSDDAFAPTKVETIKMIAYIPETANSNSYGDGIYTYSSGISFTVSLNDYLFDYGKYADEAILDYKVDVEDTYDLLETVSISDITFNEDRTIAYFDAVQLIENYEYEATGQYTFIYLQEVGPNQRISVRVTIDLAECDKFTSDILNQIEEYYGFKMNFNQDEIKAAQDDYNNNLPDVRKISAGGVKFELPRFYEEDYAETDYAEDYYAYGLNGDAYDVENNISFNVLAQEELVVNEEDLISVVNELFVDEPLKAEVGESDFQSAGKVIVSVKLSSDDLIRQGYIVYADDLLVYVYTDGSGSISDEQLEVVHHFIDTMENAY
jgi:hypothetical protein